MFSNTYLEIKEQYRPWLEQLQLTCFESLMTADIGQILESEATRESRRINQNNQVAYLKRQFIVPKKLCLETNLLLQKAHTPAVNEHIYIQKLKAQQFAVMNVMAVGERRRSGFPIEGFILVEEVTGTQLDHFLNNTDDSEQQRGLLEAYGQLIAKLHHCGFYAPLRIKDLIVTDAANNTLVMIDREVRNPYPRRQSQSRAQRSLLNSFRRTRREFKNFSDEMQSTVMEAYQCEFDNL